VKQGGRTEADSAQEIASKICLSSLVEKLLENYWKTEIWHLYLATT
jgi:hypothetical protein